ncbi:hypothetical protein HDU83_005126 [Entophlyctis luteolus]|nr:hypothetical protein HDU83_005126 [Entophlyctis luteolus]
MAKAIIVNKWTTAADLAVSSVPVPECPDDCVLINVAAAGLNFMDILMVEGKYQVRPKMPFIPGVEFAGTVIKVGSRVADYKVGERVFGSTPSSLGAFATVVAVKVTRASKYQLFRIPAGLSFREAAALYIAYPTSWLGIVEKAKLRRGEVCLVHAAAGGVGSAAVQIAKYLGATVIATAGGAEKCALVRTRLGADHVVDYREPGWVDRVVAIAASIPPATPGGPPRRGVDVVYDPVGYFIDDTRCVAWNGRILVVGFAATGGKIEAVPANRVLLKGASLIGVFWGGSTQNEPEVVPKTWDGIFRFFEAARYNDKPVRPLLYDTKTYCGIESVPEALVDLGSRKTFGKVVVDYVSRPHDAKL